MQGSGGAEVSVNTLPRRMWLSAVQESLCPFFLIVGKFKTPVLFQLAAEFLQDSNLEAGVCL